MNSDNLSFEEKINLLASTPPGPKKHELIQKFANNDTQFFRAYNGSTMPLDLYMRLHQAEFAQVAEQNKRIRANLKNHGWTDKKYGKYYAELPERLYNERPEFSAGLPRKQLKANIDAFLAVYPQFRVDK